MISAAPDRHKNTRVLSPWIDTVYVMKNAKKLCSTWVGSSLGGNILAWSPVSGNKMQNTHIPVDKAWNLKVHMLSSLCSPFGLGSKGERGFVVAIAILHSLVVEQFLSCGK